MTKDSVEKIEGWFFLVSRSKNLGFTTIVAPDFMCDAKVCSLLAFVAGGKITEARKAIYRQIHNSAVGNLTLVFRVLETTYEDIGIEGNGKIKDSFGREIPFIEGVVFKGKLTEIKVSEDIFAKIHNDIKHPYQTFWQWSYPKATIPSQSQSFENPLESECFELIIQKPYTNSPKNDDSSQKKWEILHKINRKYEISDFDISNQGDFLAVRIDDSKQTLVIIPFDARNGENIRRDDKNELEIDNQPFMIKKAANIVSETLNLVSINKSNYIAACIIKTGKNYIKIYYYNNREEQASIPIESGNLIEDYITTRISALSFINEDLIICGCKDGSIKLFNWKTQENDSKKHWSSKQITSIAISSDNKTFASSDSEGNIYFWEIVGLSISEKHEISNAHKIENGMKINSLVFHPDGKILASVDEDDYKIKLWNLAGEEVGILEEENSSD
ncbi:MAG: WD40 repeat domain-containing protein, partial [Dolichospermum sp.]